MIICRMVPNVFTMFLLEDDQVNASKMLPTAVQSAMIALMFYVLLQAMLILLVMTEKGRQEPGGGLSFCR